MLLPRNLFERFEFVLRMRPTIHNGDVLRAANVRQPARNIVGIVVAAGQPIASVPLAVGAAAGSAVYTGVLALAIYPAARLLRRVTEKQGALGVW